MAAVGMTKRPNILFILTDQQRRDTLAAYGNDWIEAPNIDGLAQRSIVFENAYVTQPVCTPSRASIMTGLYPQSTGLIGNGIHLRDDTQTIAEMISEDYYCGYFGKWHLGNDLVAQHGFEDWRSIEDWHLDAGTTTKKEHRFLESDYNTWLRLRGIEPPSAESYETWFPTANLPAEFTQAGYLGGEVSRFIREHSQSPLRDRPFMLFTSFFEPHPPYTGPLNDLYDPASLPVGPAFMQYPEGGSLANRLRAEHYLSGGLNPLAVKGGDIHDTTTEEGWRRLRAQYFANVTLVDRNVGKILRALEESGQAENTVIVFTSEHGEMAGDHGMLEKRTMYEEAVRVPLFIHIPWMSNEPRRIEGSVSLVDLVPTLLDLVGDPVPAQIEGSSLVPVLQGDKTLDDNDVFLQWNGYGDRNLGSAAINRMITAPWRSVVTGDRWKLNLSAADKCELYDLNSDSHEMRNLFDDPAHRDRVREMSARIRIWMREVGDSTPLPPV